MRAWLNFLVISILIMGALLPTQDAFACSCTSASALEYYEQSDVSFVGTIKKIQESQTPFGPDGESILWMFI